MWWEGKMDKRCHVKQIDINISMESSQRELSIGILITCDFIGCFILRFIKNDVSYVENEMCTV